MPLNHHQRRRSAPHGESRFTVSGVCGSGQSSAACYSSCSWRRPWWASGISFRRSVNRVRPLLILAPFLAYATLDYVLRVNNAIIASDLVAEFDFDAAELGFVTSAFFVAFALAQLPMGLVPQESLVLSHSPRI